MSIKWITCQHIELKKNGDPETPQRCKIFDTDPQTVEDGHHLIMMCGLCCDIITAHILREMAETMTVVGMNTVQIGQADV